VCVCVKKTCRNLKIILQLDNMTIGITFYSISFAILISTWQRGIKSKAGQRTIVHLTIYFGFAQISISTQHTTTTNLNP
jgi:hypothetical protein